jgi:hypothetical protein
MEINYLNAHKEKPISDEPSDPLLATFGEQNLHINNSADIAMLFN